MSDIELFPVNELTANESEERVFHEGVVDDVKDGIEKLASIGDASLKVLRDKRLYRSTHKTFEEYCKDRFGFSRIQAHRKIAFGNLIEDLLPQGNKTLPATERQARPLTTLPDPESQALAWELAQATSQKDQPSNREVAEAVAQVKAELEAEKRRTQEFREESNERRKAIRELETQIDLLKSEKSEPEVRIEAPSDYEATKERAEKLANDLKRLKGQQADLVQKQVASKLKEREKELAEIDQKIKGSEEILAGLQKHIDRYSYQQRELKVHLSAIEEARKALVLLAANLEGFESVIDHDHELRLWRALSQMMRNGADAIDFFVGDSKPSLTVIK